MENKEIANILYETADLMEIAGEDRSASAATATAPPPIEGHPERVADILKDPDRKVTDIPGIGKGLAAVLEEIVAARVASSGATCCCEVSRPPRSNS